MNSIFLLAQQTQVWDFLRPLVSAAEDYDLYIKAIVLLLSLGFLAISLMAYLRTKSRRFLFVTAAFGLFSLKWLLKIVDLAISPGYFFSDPVENVFELLIFVSLFLALFKK